VVINSSLTYFIPLAAFITVLSLYLYSAKIRIDFQEVK
jgi:hypothetical protein